MSKFGKNQAWFNAGIAMRSVLNATRNNMQANSRSTTTDIFLCVVDHYEPQVGNPVRATAELRVNDWIKRYPEIARKHQDSEGQVPKHSFFYPWYEYDPWELDCIAKLCASGFGETDIHLHHRDDTEDSLRDKLRLGIDAFANHGLLSRWPDGRPAWGFIHGNWALANSRCDGGRNYCGVNNEIAILKELGCYADFTFPAWKHTAQPRQINSIYYGRSGSDKPKSYDTGIRSRVGNTTQDGLLLIQGPLVPSLIRAGNGWRISMDDGDIAASRRYHPRRLDNWVKTGIHVKGRADRVFIKLHSHGAQDDNREIMLGSDLDALYSDAEARYNDGRRYRMHYVTAREMFNVVKATEAGIDDIAQCKNYLLPPPK